MSELLKSQEKRRKVSKKLATNLFLQMYSQVVLVASGWEEQCVLTTGEDNKFNEQRKWFSKQMTRLGGELTALVRETGKYILSNREWQPDRYQWISMLLWEALLGIQPDDVGGKKQFS